MFNDNRWKGIIKRTNRPRLDNVRRLDQRAENGRWMEGQEEVGGVETGVSRQRGRGSLRNWREGLGGRVVEGMGQRVNIKMYKITFLRRSKE